MEHCKNHKPIVTKGAGECWQPRRQSGNASRRQAAKMRCQVGVHSDPPSLRGWERQRPRACGFFSGISLIAEGRCRLRYCLILVV